MCPALGKIGECVTVVLYTTGGGGLGVVVCGCNPIGGAEASLGVRGHAGLHRRPWQKETIDKTKVTAH